jgi:hypothetical protein
VYDGRVKKNGAFGIPLYKPIHQPQAPIPTLLRDPTILSNIYELINRLRAACAACGQGFPQTLWAWKVFCDFLSVVFRALMQIFLHFMEKSFMLV